MMLARTSLHGNDEVHRVSSEIRVQIGVQVQPSMVGVSKLEQRASYLHANPAAPGTRESTAHGAQSEPAFICLSTPTLPVPS